MVKNGPSDAGQLAVSDFLRQAVAEQDTLQRFPIYGFFARLNLDRSHHPNLERILLRVLGARPHRCESCEHRFYSRKKAARDLSCGRA